MDNWMETKLKKIFITVHIIIFCELKVERKQGCIFNCARFKLHQIKMCQIQLEPKR
jgi:hypothetical protein